MGLIIRLVELLLVLVPLVGVILAVVKGISAATKRSAERDGELPSADGDPVQPRILAAKSQAAQWRTITRVLDEHHRTDSRWLSYELDAA
ncbi:MAG: hypothetical protein KC495_16920, partial [Dehalococcoidia bacterium]|nr:hypothetical protein [Dehalococcoidia bacterium]